MTSGIYVIYNTVNNKAYIGQSKDIRQRWWSHRHSLRKNKHGNSHLQNAWNKYGEEAFDFGVLKLCELSELDHWESVWGELYESYKEESGYNVSRNFTNPNLGSVKGPLSEDAKRKISEANKKLFEDEEYRAWRKSIHQTDAVVQKKREATQKRYQDDAERAKTGSFSKNLWKDPEYAEKVKEGRRRQWADPETRARMIAAMKAAHAKRRGSK